MGMSAEVKAELDAFDGEFNKQVIPPKVWRKLLDAYGRGHSATMHKGTYLDFYTQYMYGVADALFINREDLDEAVRLDY